MHSTVLHETNFLSNLNNILIDKLLSLLSYNIRMWLKVIYFYTNNTYIQSFTSDDTLLLHIFVFSSNIYSPITFTGS